MSTETTKLLPRRKPAKPKTLSPARKAKTVKPTGSTKQSQLIELLQRDGGATTAELASALKWLPHTTRAALTGLRKKGHAVVSEKVNGETRYRIQRAAA